MLTTLLLSTVVCFNASVVLPAFAEPKAEGDCLSELTHEGSGLDIDPELEVDDLFGYIVNEGRCCSDTSYLWYVFDAPNTRYRLRVQSDCYVDAPTEGAVSVGPGGVAILEWTPPNDNCGCSYLVFLETATPTGATPWSYVSGSSIEISCEVDCD